MKMGTKFKKKKNKSEKLWIFQVILCVNIYKYMNVHAYIHIECMYNLNVKKKSEKEKARIAEWKKKKHWIGNKFNGNNIGNEINKQYTTLWCIIHQTHSHTYAQRSKYEEKKKRYIGMHNAILSLTIFFVRHSLFLFYSHIIVVTFRLLSSLKFNKQTKKKFR